MDGDPAPLTVREANVSAHAITLSNCLHSTDCTDPAEFVPLLSFGNVFALTKQNPRSGLLSFLAFPQGISLGYCKH